MSIEDADRVVLDGPAIEAEGLADWRVLLGVLHARFETGGFNQGVTLVQAIGAAADEMDHHPDVVLTYPSVDVRLSSHDVGGVTRRDVILARAISEMAAGLGAAPRPSVASAMELALDTPDAAEIRPFWAAVLGFELSGPYDELVDPTGQAPHDLVPGERAARGAPPALAPRPAGAAGGRRRPHRGRGRRRRSTRQRRRGAEVLGAGRQPGQPGVPHDLAGPHARLNSVAPAAPLDQSEVVTTTSSDLWDRATAATYDESSAFMFAPEVLDPAVERLGELAEGGRALEMAIGTGRVAVPLAERGVDVSGIELSRPMVDRLREKRLDIPVVVGDMATVSAPGQFSLVYVVWNSIANLRTQAEQVACFRNAARHLAPGGRFVVELWVPGIRRFPPGRPGCRSTSVSTTWAWTPTTWPRSRAPRTTTAATTTAP